MLTISCTDNACDNILPKYVLVKIKNTSYAAKKAKQAAEKFIYLKFTAKIFDS